MTDTGTGDTKRHDCRSHPVDGRLSWRTYQLVPSTDGGEDIEHRQEHKVDESSQRAVQDSDTITRILDC